MALEAPLGFPIASWNTPRRSEPTLKETHLLSIYSCSSHADSGSTLNSKTCLSSLIFLIQELCGRGS